MGQGEPKYLNSRETVLFDKGRNLYGLCYARRTRENMIILCEGYMDVISLHQAGFTNAVAPLGTAFTPGQAMILKRYTKEVALAFDSDQAGVNAAIRALPILREAGLSGRVISLAPYKDPDELIQKEGTEAFAGRVREAVPGRMFELMILEGQFNQSDPAGRTEFLHAAARKLSEISEPVERNVYIDSAANRFMMKREDLAELVNRYGQSIDRARANEQYRKQPETIERKKRRIEDQRSQPQRILLTWLLEHPETYPLIRPYVGPEDFTIPLYHSAAVMLFDQLDQGKEPAPARIISAYPDAGDQKKIAEMFNTRLPYDADSGNRDKAITEIVRKIKRAVIDEKLSRAVDIREAQELMDERNRIQKLQISLA